MISRMTKSGCQAYARRRPSVPLWATVTTYTLDSSCNRVSVAIELSSSTTSTFSVIERILRACEDQGHFTLETDYPSNRQMAGIDLAIQVHRCQVHRCQWHRCQVKSANGWYRPCHASTGVVESGLLALGVRLAGRTADSGSVWGGSNPSPPAWDGGGGGLRA